MICIGVTKEEIRRSKISVSLIGNTRALGRVVSDEEKLIKSLALKGRVPWNKGKPCSEMTKRKMSTTRKGKVRPWMHRTPTDETKRKLKEASRKAWENPTTRKKYHDALEKTKWLKVRTDNGQLVLLEKWNRLGFRFEPNFQLRSGDALFYIDGYDKEHNVVLEYDGKYHRRPKQKEKDLSRQQKIIETLNPKRFWRFDGVNKTVRNILGDSSGGQ